MYTQILSCFLAADPALFWAALAAIAQSVEAVVVLASAVIVVFQLRRFRRQSLESKISGLKMAMDTLDADPLEKVTRGLAAATTLEGINWQDLLNQIDLVALLVDERYTDETLLLAMRGQELAATSHYIETHAIPGQPLAELPATHDRAYALLHRASLWARERQS
jgi:hypothetical protein